MFIYFYVNYMLLRMNNFDLFKIISYRKSFINIIRIVKTKYRLLVVTYLLALAIEKKNPLIINIKRFGMDCLKFSSD